MLNRSLLSPGIRLLALLIGLSALLRRLPLLALLGRGTIGLLAPLLCGLALLRPLAPLRRGGRLLSRCRGNVRGTPLLGSRSISLLPVAGSLLWRQRLTPLLWCSRWLLARKWHVALSLALPGLLRGQRLSPLLLLRLLHGGCTVLLLLTPLLGSLRGLLRGHRRVTGQRLLYVRRWCRSRRRSGSLWLDLWRGRRLVLRKRCRRRSVLRLSLRLCRGCLRALLRVKLRFLCRCRCRTGNGRRIGLSLRFGLRLFSLVVFFCGNSLFDRCSFFCRCSLFCLCGLEGLGLRFLRSRFRPAHLRQCGFYNWCRLIVWHGSRGYSCNRLLGLCGRMTRLCLRGELSRSE